MVEEHSAAPSFDANAETIDEQTAAQLFRLISSPTGKNFGGCWSTTRA